jgi:DNA-binding NarL/FixJ family response regulator
MMRLPRVLIADDHAIFTEGLVSLLKDRFDVVGTVGDGHQLVEAAGRLRPDVIVADVSMPVLTGLEALRRLKAKPLAAKVIVLTMHADARLAREALKAGASGFVLKQSSGDELVTAIQEVLQGRTYLTPALTKDVISLMSDVADPSEVEVTPRQREILRHIVKGKRMKEIAAALDLSTRTVETLKYELMRALNVHSTAELVRYAIERHLVSD